jgi:predicted methyltransferase
LKDEKVLALKLLNSLSEEQKKTAIIGGDAPGDIITRIDRKAMIKDPGGITYAQMNSGQRENFLELVKLYIHRYKKNFC